MTPLSALRTTAESTGPNLWNLFSNETLLQYRFNFQRFPKYFKTMNSVKANSILRLQMYSIVVFITEYRLLISYLLKICCEISAKLPLLVSWVDLIPPGLLKETIPVVEVFMDNTPTMVNFSSMGLIY